MNRIPDSASLARLKPLLYLAGVAGLILALLTIERPSADDIPSWGRLAMALALTVTSLWLAANQWSSLLGVEGEQRARSHRAVYISQLAKYLPAGGLLQIAGQVSLTDSVQFSPGNRLFLYLVGVVQLCAACAIAGLLILTEPVEDLWWIVVIIAPLGLVALPPVLRWGSSFLARFQRFDVQLPRDSSLIRSQFFAVANIMALSAAFAAVVATPGTTSIVATMGAFALAWLAGFVVFPIPAGVGIREAALVGLLPSVSPPQILVAGLLLRLFGLLAEVLLLSSASVRVRSVAGSQR